MYGKERSYERKDRPAAPISDCPSAPVRPTGHPLRVSTLARSPAQPRSPPQGFSLTSLCRPQKLGGCFQHPRSLGGGHSLGRAPRRYTPPPSLSMHPASMLILDLWSSPWVSKSGDYSLRISSLTNTALIPERIRNLNPQILMSICERPQRVPKPRKMSYLYLSGANCVGLGRKRRSPPQPQFSNFICQLLPNTEL